MAAAASDTSASRPFSVSQSPPLAGVSTWRDGSETRS